MQRKVIYLEIQRAGATNSRGSVDLVEIVAFSNSKKKPEAKALRVAISFVNGLGPTGNDGPLSCVEV